MSDKRIVITGYGLVTPLGHSSWETFSALLGGKTLADRAAGLPKQIDPVDLVRALGSVSTAVHSATDPAVELAEQAAREALFMAGVKPNSVSCVIGASKGAMTAFTAAAQHHHRRSIPANGNPRPGHRHRPTPRPPRDAHLAIALGPQGYLAHHLTQRLGVRGARPWVAACASSLVALHQARMALLRADRATGWRKMLVVTSEACLLPILIHSYKRLGVLPPLTPDQYVGRPLDQRRSGFILAQSAAAVVLEAQVGPPKPGQIELVDSAVACDPHDLVRPSPQMPALTNIANRLLNNRAVDLIHPHATGTAHHDPVELGALALALRGPADVYACKGALGHGLGAGGLTALVIACLCAQAQRRPPMPWLHEPLPSPSPALTVTRDGVPGPLSTQAVFAAGFGGHVAGAVVQRPNHG